MIDLSFYFILIPLLGILGTLLLPSNQVKLIRILSWLSLTATLVLAFFLLIKFDGGQKEFQWVTQIAWLDHPRIVLQLGLDGLNIWLVVLTAVVAFCSLFAVGSIQKNLKAFHILYLMLVTGAFGAFLALDLFFFFLFLEIEVLVAYPLIANWGRDNKKYAAMQFTLFAFLASAFVLVGLLGIYFLTDANTSDLIRLNAYLQGSPLELSVQHKIFLPLLIGFGILSAVWPFHSWGPIGYVEAPTSTSMLLAGVLKKVGAYGLIRFGLLFVPDAAEFWMPWVTLLLMMNLVYVGFIALAQKELRRLISYSSSSHMGLVLIGIACVTPLGVSGAVLIMFAHGLLVALLFLITDFIERKTNTTQIEALGGLARHWPITATGFALATFACASVPGFANFSGELITLFAVWNQYTWMVIGILICVLLTAVYMFRALRNIFFGPLPDILQSSTEPIKSPLHILPLVLLVGFLLAVGFAPNLVLSDLETSLKNTPLTEKGVIFASF